MIWRNIKTGECSIIDPCYDPAYWNGVKEERVILKSALASGILEIRNDGDNWISAWYRGRFISGWLRSQPDRAREILYVIARMLRTKEA